MRTEIEQVFREHYGRAVATLIRGLGDIDLAEEAVQDAFAAALDRWPSTGIPPSPAGWLITTARNRALDRLRREAGRDGRRPYERGRSKAALAAGGAHWGDAAKPRLPRCRRRA